MRCVGCRCSPGNTAWRGLGIIQHHQARGTDAMSDGTRLHQLFASRLKRQQCACTSLQSHRSHMAITATVLVACVLYDATTCWRGLGIIQHHQARGTDAMSDGTRLHQLFASRLKRHSATCMHQPCFEAIVQQALTVTDSGGSESAVEYLRLLCGHGCMQTYSTQLHTHVTQPRSREASSVL